MLFYYNTDFIMEYEPLNQCYNEVLVYYSDIYLHWNES